MAYPASIDTFTTKTSADYVLAAHVNALQTAVIATQTELGTDPAGTVATVKARFEAIEATTNLLPAKKRRFNILTVKGDPANPPLDDVLTGTLVSTPVMWFSPTVDQKVHFTFNIPPDCDTDENITLCLDCVGEEDGAASETVGIELYYIVVASAATITGATERTVDIAGGLDVSAWVAERRYSVTSLAISSAHIATGSTVHCTLCRDTDDDDNYPHDFGVFNISMEYTNKNPA